MKPTSGNQPPPYSLASLILDKEQAGWEHQIHNHIAQRSDPTSRLSGAFFLPTEPFARDLVMGTASAGGNLAGQSMQRVAAAARPTLLLERLGAQRVAVNRVGTASLPVFDPGQGGWVAEGASAGTMSTTTTRVITCSGKMAAARLGLSRRMLNMVADIESSVLGEVSRSVEAVVEAGLIAGDGSNNQPLGLINTTGITPKAFAAATPTWAELMAMVELAGDNDADLARCVFLMHPSDLADLLQTEVVGATGQTVVAFIDGQHRIGGFPVHASTHMPEGKVAFVDPFQLRTVYWGSPQILVDPFSSGKSISGALEIIVFNMVDVAVLYPSQLILGSN